MSKQAISWLVCAIGLGGLLAAGCVSEGRVHATGTATVTAAPTLVEIRPGVWVVEDYHAPVFWSDGYYWLYDDGMWYRSGYYGRSWVRVRTNVIPRPLLRIDRPRHYVRYHAKSRATVRDGPPRVRDHRDQRKRTAPARRDHRDRTRIPSTRAPKQDRRKAPPPRRGKRTRDHRD